MTFIDGRPIGMNNFDKISLPQGKKDITSELVSFINNKIQATDRSEGSDFVSRPQTLDPEKAMARVSFDQNQLQAQSHIIRQQLGI